MAIPYLGIAGGLLLGAAVTGLAVAFGRGGGEQTQQSAPAAQAPARNTRTFRPTSAGSQATQRPTFQQSNRSTPRGNFGAASPIASAKPITVAAQAESVADNITSLPVFTPTAPEPVTTTQDYQSVRRLEVKKSKAGEQTLRNPLDGDRKSSAIKSGLPSIGVSSSDPAGVSKSAGGDGFYSIAPVSGGPVRQPLPGPGQLQKPLPVRGIPTRK